MTTLTLPADFDAVCELACQRARGVPGMIEEDELRALAMLAAAAPGPGVIVEIGSFKGRSTVALATVVERYGGGPVVAIDPHDAPPTERGGEAYEPSYDAFLAALRWHGLTGHVEVHRASSRQVISGWRRPIRLLWIDGDHTYAGAHADFELYSPFVAPGGLIALHDTLNFFDGPIRVFVEEMLRSDRFGPAGFLRTIGWSQFRPQDGHAWRLPRRKLARRAVGLLPLAVPPRRNRGFNRWHCKLARARIPHAVPPPAAWSAGLSAPPPRA